MKLKRLLIFTVVTAILGGLCAIPVRADDTIDIRKPVNFLGLTKPTPIAITGFSGEVESVLKYDLTVMGFIPVDADAAQYVLSGSNNGNLQAVLSSGGSAAGARGVLFTKIYTGASLRAMAHRLSDDVSLKITGVNGIAESKIAFKVNYGGNGEIYIADFDGHNAQAVTHDGTICAAPCWVPGRLALYYTSYKLGAPHIFYQNLSTGDRRDFAHYPGMNSGAAVSPDGSQVAMVLSKGGSCNIYVCDADGGNLRQLTRTREDESSPCWSPDGQWICYNTKINGRRVLSKVSAHGGPPQRIPTAGVSNPSEPNWSPDGRWIAFTSQHAGGFDICVVPAQGGGATPLVAGEDPCWSANSRTLVYVRQKGWIRTLSLLDVPTKQVKDVSRVSGSNSVNSEPSWDR